MNFRRRDMETGCWGYSRGYAPGATCLRVLRTYMHLWCEQPRSSRCSRQPSACGLHHLKGSQQPPNSYQFLKRLRYMCRIHQIELSRAPWPHLLGGDI